MGERLMYAGIIISVIVVILFVISFTIASIWNWVMPGVFGVSEITELQAFAMFLLIQLLFPSPYIKK